MLYRLLRACERVWALGGDCLHASPPPTNRGNDESGQKRENVSSNPSRAKMSGNVSELLACESCYCWQFSSPSKESLVATTASFDAQEAYQGEEGLFCALIT